MMKERGSAVVITLEYKFIPQAMSANEKLFHPECFSCNCCNIPLRPGDVFALQGNFLFCPSGYATLQSVAASMMWETLFEIRRLLQLKTLRRTYAVQYCEEMHR